MGDTVRMEEELVNLLRIFDKNRIKYCITSGYAVHVYSNLRKPSDIDVIVKRRDLPRVSKLLKIKISVEENILGNNELIRYSDNVEICCFDNYSYKDEKYSFPLEDDDYTKARIYMVNGYPVRIIPIEKLVKLKLFLVNRNKHDKRDLKLLGEATV